MAAAEAKKLAKQKAKLDAQTAQKEDDPRMAWKKDFNEQPPGSLNHVLRMGIHSLKDYLLSLGCSPEELEGVSDKDRLANRVAPKYLALAHSQEMQLPEMLQSRIR